MLWLGKPLYLRNLAYSGFFWSYLLAISAHVAVADGEFFGALVCFGLLCVSFYSRIKLNGDS